MSSPQESIPVTLLTGFLGSGKTTLLNHLVRQPELADALVIINEFGEMALDHQLVTHSRENLIMEMSSGCVCCNIRGDLVQTLRDILWRFSRQGQRQFRRVLIETTGLADPAPIIHTLMTHPQIAPQYRLDGILTTLDMATGMHSLDEYPEAVKQVAMADVLLLTKSDLVEETQRQALIARLQSLNPAARQWPLYQGEIAAEKLLNLGLFSANGKIGDVERWLKEEAYPRQSLQPLTQAANGWALQTPSAQVQQAVNRHKEQIRAFCFAVAEPIPEKTLIAWLDMLMGFAGNNILRIKGILHLEGEPLPVVVHGVQHLFHPPVSLPAWPSEDRRSRLVFITRDLDSAMIEKSFEAFQKVLPARKSP